MPSFRLVIQYDGTRFAGWQVQPGQRTIQGEVRDLLRRLNDEPDLRLAGAARTDAGAHALGQVASFTTCREWDSRKLARALNRLLPSDIAVREVSAVGEAFHARRSAAGRIYRYQIACGEVLSPFTAPYVHHYRGELDLDRMRAAAAHFLGEHDFTSFRAAGDVSSSRVKTMRRCDVAREGDLVRFTVEGSSFLQHMVRTMAGTLLEVGRGRWEPGRVAEALARRDRSAAGPTLPARGLFLVEVLYAREGRGALPGGENG